MVTGAVFTLGVLLYISSVQADVFSIDRDSPSASMRNPADILFADGGGPSVGKHVGITGLGLASGDELDALSQGLDVVSGIIFFSVDRNSEGEQIVLEQSILNQEAGDIFVSTDALDIMARPQGFNGLDTNQHRFDLAPLISTQGDSSNNLLDDLDAYSMEEFDFDLDRTADVPVYFSLRVGSPTLTSLSASAADILVYDPDAGLSVAFASGSLGLESDDDLDALALNVSVGSNAPIAYFSLAPGSSSLAGISGSAADIFITGFDGSFHTEYAHSLLGLLSTDNVDALETNPIPEPASAALVAAAACLLGLWRQRRI